MIKRIIVTASILIVGVFAVFSLKSCGSSEDGGSVSGPPVFDCPKLSSNRVDLNISFLLDLSDRIDTTKYPDAAMQYYERDLGLIDQIAGAFECHLLYKRLVQMEDQVAVYFDPPPQNTEINRLAGSLKLGFTKDNASQEGILAISDTYHNTCRQIYNLALDDGDYVGSDIWGFFNRKVKDYCIKEDHRNILVILTDGYLYHERNVKNDGKRYSYLLPKTIRTAGLTGADWKSKIESQDFGLLQATDGLENLEVLVMNVNPSDNNVYDLDILNHVWVDWLTGMGVQRVEFKESDLPSNLSGFLTRYIHEE